MDFKDLDFIMVGPSKTGTVWLAQCLREHKDIFVAPENNYLTHSKHLGHQYFEAQFKNAGKPGGIIGDVSNWYLSYVEIPELLHKLNPNLKIIINIREPVERAISFYYHDINRATLGKHIHLQRAIGRHLLYYRYIHPARYSVHIKEYLKYFNADQIYLFSSPSEGGDLKKRLDDLFDFLGVKSEKVTSINKTLNVRKTPFSPFLYSKVIFGKRSLGKSFFRAINSLNNLAGKILSKTLVDQVDIEAVKKVFLELKEKENLQKIKEKNNLRGDLFLENWDH